MNWNVKLSFKYYMYKDIQKILASSLHCVHTSHMYAGEKCGNHGM